MYSDLEDNEEEKMKKLTCCAKVLLYSLEKELSQSYYINNYKLLITFLYKLLKNRKSSYFNVSKSATVLSIFRKFLLTKFNYSSNQR